MTGPDNAWDHKSLVSVKPKSITSNKYWRILKIYFKLNYATFLFKLIFLNFWPRLSKNGSFAVLIEIFPSFVRHCRKFLAMEHQKELENIFWNQKFASLFWGKLDKLLLLKALLDTRLNCPLIVFTLLCRHFPNYCSS